jgi:MoaA/NifB/PqqE/SkfB family radical SAM enzyme
MNAIAVAERVVKNLPHVVRREPVFFFTEILLTYHCTQHCLHCKYPLIAPGTKAIAFNDFTTIVDRLDAYGGHGIMLSGGDPIVHPQLYECIEYVASKRFTYRHMLSTLYFPLARVEELTAAILKHRFSLTVSFDGLGETADRLRGAKDVSRTTMEHMEFVDQENRKAGRRIKTGVNIVVSQLNLHQIEQILEYVEELGWFANVDIFRTPSVELPASEHLLIRDQERLRQVMERAKASPAVVTPAWVLDGFVKYLNGSAPKFCPYLLSPSFGSRFFVHPNGDVNVCFGSPVGNLLRQTPGEILRSLAWDERVEEFKACTGCWNSCLTPFAKVSNYELSDLRKNVSLMWNFRNGNGVK